MKTSTLNNSIIWHQKPRYNIDRCVIHILSTDLVSRLLIIPIFSRPRLWSWATVFSRLNNHIIYGYENLNLKIIEVANIYKKNAYRSPHYPLFIYQSYLGPNFKNRSKYKKFSSACFSKGEYKLVKREIRNIIEFDLLQG